MTITLASASPRRSELLSKLTNDFTVEPSNIVEGSSHKNPKKRVREIARSKALSVNGKVVLAADTMVYFKGKEYGKPKDADDAVSMLTNLSCNWHTVYTAVCVKIDEKIYEFVCKSRVKFKELPKELIFNYIEKYKPFDKAGAYGVQDNEIVERYRGSYSNIMGLPLEKLEKVLFKIEKTQNIKLLG